MQAEDGSRPADRVSRHAGCLEDLPADQISFRPEALLRRLGQPGVRHERGTMSNRAVHQARTIHHNRAAINSRRQKSDAIALV
jgi:hypothetical protein